MADIEIKARISADTSSAKTSVDNLNSSLGNTKKGIGDSVGSFSNLKKSLTEISPAAESASKASNLFNNALNVLKANPIIAVIAAIVLVVVALFEKFKKMESVSDSLGKAFGKLSGVFNTFIDAILTPLIDGFVFLVDLWTNTVIGVLDALGLTSAKTAERFGEITEALDDLEDSQKNAAIATAEANRKLQEAREIAGDANVPIKERIEALKLAGKIEKEELDKVVEINRKKTALVLESIAMELGAKSDLIAKIREGSLENLKAARLELANMKNVDKEKLYAIDQQIIAAENAAAQSAKIGKKTDAAIKGLQKEQEAKDKEIADKKKAAQEKELAEYNKFLQLKNKLQNEANLAEINNDVVLNIQKVKNQENDKLREVETLKVSEKNKAELRAMIHKSSLQEIEKINNEAAEKSRKKAEDEQKKIEEDAKKASDKLLSDAEKQMKVEEDLEQKRINAKIKKANEQAKLGNELLNPFDKEIAQLEDSYKKKLAIASGNEALIAAVQQQFAEQTSEIKSKHLNDQLNETKNIGDSISEVIGKQTAVGKGLGIATALINTYQGATDALRAKSTLPSPFDVVAKIVNVSAVLATGFKAVKAITAVQVPGGSGGGGGANIASPVAPTQALTKLDSASIQGVGNAAGAGVGRSFVLESDISNNAERTAMLNRAARLG